MKAKATVRAAILIFVLVGLLGSCSEETSMVEEEAGTLGGQFELEARDDAWADIAEGTIQRVMEGTIALSLKFTDFEIECRQTTCRLVLNGLDADGPDYDRLTTILDEIQRSEGFRSERSEEIHRDPGFGEFYFSREGFGVN